MPTWQSDYIETNNIRLHYRRTGGTKPPVVLAHGFSDDSLCWTPVTEALAVDYDVIMVDARGHGRSDAPEQGYGSAEHAADLAGVITGLGLQRPAVLGHSMGAMTALTLAGTYPTVVGAILLEDPPAAWMPEPSGGPNNERWAQMQAWARGLKRQTHDELIAGGRASSPGWSEAELGPWADAKHRLSLNVLNRNNSAPVDWAATVRAITCPTLLITADPARGAIVTAEGAAALQAMLPQARVAHIANAGHSIRRDQFARYLAVVWGFLAEIATYR